MIDFSFIIPTPFFFFASQLVRRGHIDSLPKWTATITDLTQFSQVRPQTLITSFFFLVLVTPSETQVTRNLSYRGSLDYPFHSFTEPTSKLPSIGQSHAFWWRASSKSLEQSSLGDWSTLERILVDWLLLSVVAHCTCNVLYFPLVKSPLVHVIQQSPLV